MSHRLEDCGCIETCPVHGVAGDPLGFGHVDVSKPKIEYGAVDVPDEWFEPEAVRRLVSEAELNAMEHVIATARQWYDVQRGTMAAQAPSGLAVRDALTGLDKVRE